MTTEPHRALRDSLGRFATGIGILTTRDAAGTPVGLTINSFNSVSLDPPLVVFSLDRRLKRLPVFQNTPYFGISLLRADQEAVSNAFAGDADAAFRRFAWREGRTGVPLIDGAIAVFELASYAQHDGGDHVLFLARVLYHEWQPGEPLIYFAGNYRQLA